MYMFIIKSNTASHEDHMTNDQSR